MIRTYNPVHRVQVFGELSTIDYGDSPTAPGYIEPTLERIEEFVRPIAEARGNPGSAWVATTRSRWPSCARLRCSVQGPLGLVHLDSHTDLWDTLQRPAPYSHGTMFRRALEEGILDPARVLQGWDARAALLARPTRTIPDEPWGSRRSRGSTCASSPATEASAGASARAAR